MDNFIAFLVGSVALLIVAALSWVVCNFLVWLICLCFGFEFTFWIGTGVWAVIIVLRGIFK